MSSIARVRPRGDTAANWTAANPILAFRELAIETDTRRFKVGDGTSPWNALPYYSDGVSVRGQASRMTSGTISIATAGAYVSTGLTATFDSTTASGMTLGTTDLFALKNTSGATKLLRFYASIDASAGNNHILGIKLAKNGTAIDASECRAYSASGNAIAKLATNWMISVAANEEVSVRIANISDTTTINFQRGRIVASEVRS